MSILTILAGAMEPVTKLISEFIEDPDKANQLRTTLAAAQLDLQGKMIEQESELNKARGAIIVAEAQSTSWITANWRPVTMLTFVGLVVAKWLGFTMEGVDPALELELMSLIKIGLGGYVVGRSAEKVLPNIAEIFARK